MRRLCHALIQPFRHRDLMTEADKVTEQRDTLCIDLTLSSTKFSNGGGHRNGRT